MTPATMNTKKLEIDGMTGDVCVQKVKTALKGVQGVTTDSVSVGEATIKADDAGCKAACSAIGRAGYEAHAEDQDGEEGGVDDDSSRNPLKSSSAKGDVTQSRTSNPNNSSKDDRGNMSSKQGATKS